MRWESSTTGKGSDTGLLGVIKRWFSPLLAEYKKGADAHDFRPENISSETISMLRQLVEAKQEKIDHLKYQIKQIASNRTESATVRESQLKIENQDYQRRNAELAMALDKAKRYIDQAEEENKTLRLANLEKTARCDSVVRTNTLLNRDKKSYLEIIESQRTKLGEARRKIAALTKLVKELRPKKSIAQELREEGERIARDFAKNPGAAMLEGVGVRRGSKRVVRPKKKNKK